MFVLWERLEICISLENVVGLVCFSICFIKCVLNLGIFNVFVFELIFVGLILSDFVDLNSFMIFGLLVGIVFGLILFKFCNIWIVVGLLCLSIFNFNMLLWIEWKLKWVVFYFEFVVLVGNCIGVKL